MPTRSTIQIKNKKASYEYELLEKMVAGIKLQGTEIKSIREGKASLSDSYCFFQKGELYVKNMHIAEYSKGTHFNHEPTRTRKLLLNKREINKLEKGKKERGYTIIPLRMFISDTGYAKLEIALARGKKVHDKRASIKEKDLKKEIDRGLKNYR
ncbi:MAG: SsrA-binding protein SmpB [Bacteroidetes bacterium]|nr:SsrA-binding protein SmpB [Bacteroidota bacterium]